MKKILVIGIVVLISLFLAGCEEEAGTGDAGDVSVGGKAFIGDPQDGLQIEFLQGAPPDEVYDTNFPFGMSVKIENVGEYDINAGSEPTENQIVVSITGIDHSDFKDQGTQLDFVKSVTEDLRGASLDPAGNKIDGAFTNVDYEELQYQSEVTGTLPLTMQANVCYTYGTKVVSKLCILEDLFTKTGREPFCDPNRKDSNLENSAAPVIVDSFRQSVAGKDRLTFQFNVKHAGDGTISRKGSDCSRALADKNKVNIKVETGLAGLTCSGIQGGTTEGTIDLFGSNGAERTVTCTEQLRESMSDFEKPIERLFRKRFWLGILNKIKGD